ncbi:hypothetical protein Y1Q_0014836 [Alligator mississippiensis]|uniref:Uncharacterized protein n=1 Tax=Alligator mississippiensis TaxID=8496 RepID=A0A151M250_ALLMI|nr:hypothetical protein Y1Q_0014836 [Alligator mississippiensis]
MRIAMSLCRWESKQAPDKKRKGRLCHLFQVASSSDEAKQQGRAGVKCTWEGIHRVVLSKSRQILKEAASFPDIMKHTSAKTFPGNLDR